MESNVQSIIEAALALPNPIGNFWWNACSILCLPNRKSFLRKNSLLK